MKSKVKKSGVLNLKDMRTCVQKIYDEENNRHDVKEICSLLKKAYDLEVIDSIEYGMLLFKLHAFGRLVLSKEMYERLRNIRV